MANQAFPILDGVSPSWADVSVKLTATGAPLLDIHDIKSISTGSSLEVGEQREGGRLMSRTTGNEKSEASMTLYYSGFVKFLENLAIAGFLRGNQTVVGLVHFGLQYIMTPPNSAGLYEVRVQGCRYMGRTNAPAEGPDAVTIDVALNPQKIIDVVNGKQIVLL